MLRLCDRDVTGLRLRLTLIGDRHEFLAYDLALANGEEQRASGRAYRRPQ